MADFPVLKWLSVDGRNVPFTYPQHKKKDGSFVVTGEENPLPVAGYGMTDSGIWIPKKVADDGTTLTQVIGNVFELATDTNVSILAGETYDLIINKDINFRELRIYARGSWGLRSSLDFRISVGGKQAPGGLFSQEVFEDIPSNDSRFLGKITSKIVGSSLERLAITNSHESDVTIQEIVVTGFI